jgi:beta-xylosidase
MRTLRLTQFLAASAAASTALAQASFVPVLKDNFPDAFVLQHKGEAIAYATNDGANLPIAVSRDLINWTIVADPANPKKKYDAMPALGPWAKEGFTWAPEVFEIGGKWHLYYTASSRKHDAQCIGLAIADDPRGPFRDASAEPFVCQPKLGGTIDANVLKDTDGKLYIYYKNDGNRVKQRTALWGQRLSDDGRATLGQPVQLITDRERWVERVIEAPTMVRGPTGYTLFYSGGFFGWNPNEGGLSPYAMGYATCTGPLGPCQAAPENPVLHSFKDKEAGCISGPGHQSVFEANGRTYISFHAWAATPRCTKLEDERYLYIAPLFWRDGKPTLGPSLRPQRLGERG